MKVDEILSTSLFKSFTNDELIDALRAMKAHTNNYKKGEVIMAAGTKPKSIGFVLKGSVIIENNDMLGGRSIIDSIQPGGVFAETYALKPELILPVDVTAAENCSVLFINVFHIDDFSQVRSWYVRLLQNLLELAVSRNYALIIRSFHTHPKTVRGRVLAYLNTQSMASGSRNFLIPFDRQQMADYLNLDRSALSKELAKMKKDGLIDYKKNHFRLCTDSLK